MRLKDKAELNQMVREYGLQAIVSQAADDDTTPGEMFLNRLRGESVEFAIEAFISACYKRKEEIERTGTTTYDTEQARYLTKFLLRLLD